LSIIELYKRVEGRRLARVAQQDFVEEGALELLPDSVVLDGKRLEELLMQHLYITQTGKRIRLGCARITIEWLEKGYREVFQAG
jgi:hypothetical protein